MHTPSPSRSGPDRLGQPGRYSPDFLARIASFLPGEMVATGLIGVSKSLTHEQVRGAVTAPRFEIISRDAPGLDSNNKDDSTAPVAAAVMATIVVRFSKLASANLSGYANLESGWLAEAVVSLAGHCPGLTSVNLWDCGNLTDAAVLALAQHCPGLTSVNLG